MKRALLLALLIAGLSVAAKAQFAFPPGWWSSSAPPSCTRTLVFAGPVVFAGPAVFAKGC